MLKTKIKNLCQNNKGKIIIILSVIMAIGVIQIGNFTIKAYKEIAYFISNPIPAYAIADVEIADKIPMREWVLNEVKKAGLDVDYVDRLINCESKWNNWAVAWNKNGSIDYGIWQINSIHKGTISVEDRFDYKEATDWAIQKRLHDGNWSAWSCSRIIK